MSHISETGIHEYRPNATTGYELTRGEVEFLRPKIVEQRNVLIAAVEHVFARTVLGAALGSIIGVGLSLAAKSITFLTPSILTGGLLFSAWGVLEVTLFIAIAAAIELFVRLVLLVPYICLHSIGVV